MKRFVTTFLGGNNIKTGRILQKKILEELKIEYQKEALKEEKDVIMALNALEHHPAFFIEDNNFPEYIFMTYETSNKITKTGKGFVLKEEHFSREHPEKHKQLAPVFKFEKNKLDRKLYMELEKFTIVREINVNKLLTVSLKDLYQGPKPIINFYNEFGDAVCQSHNQRTLSVIQQCIWSPVATAKWKVDMNTQIRQNARIEDYYDYRSRNKSILIEDKEFFQNFRTNFSSYNYSLTNDSSSLELFTDSKELALISSIDLFEREKNIDKSVKFADEANNLGISLEENIVFYNKSKNLDLIFPNFSTELNKKYSEEEQTKILVFIFKNQHGQAIFKDEMQFLRPLDAVHVTLYKMNNLHMKDLALGETEYNIGEIIAKNITYF